MVLDVGIRVCNWWWLGWGSVLMGCRAVYLALKTFILFRLSVYIASMCCAVLLVVHVLFLLLGDLGVIRGIFHPDKGSAWLGVVF